MNSKSLFYCVAFILITHSANCQSTPRSGLDGGRQRPKYKIDGIGADWNTNQVAWAETGLDWSKADVQPEFDGIDIKAVYWDNDDAYLYLFLKCKPSVQERYDKTHRTGALGYLYIDTDLDSDTGAGDEDSDGQSTVRGAEVQIYLPTGFSLSADKDALVMYEMKRWDSKSKLFSQDVRTENSRSTSSLIAHGKDGVEIALLLSDLKVAKKQKFNLACWESSAPRVYINRTVIEIK